MNENNKKSNKSFLGYYLPIKPLPISIIGIFGALTFLLTIIFKLPILATLGYFNIGDLGVMISGILFGPIVGSLAGGIGSSLGDIFLAAPEYAIPTLIIKGIEGFLIGLISNPRKHYKDPGIRDIIAVIIGGCAMVMGYFSLQWIVFGLPSALAEIGFNFLQMSIGAIGALIFAFTVRKNLIISMNQVFEKIFMFDLEESKSEELISKKIEE
jgi:uncharacterized membrane protein